MRTTPAVISNVVMAKLRVPLVAFVHINCGDLTAVIYFRRGHH
jgi:hypothetical protein